MGLFKNIFQKASSIKTPFVSTVFQRYNSQIGMASAKGLYEYKNWVFACVSARSEGVGEIDLYLYDKQKQEKVESHVLLDLLYKANPATTKYELFESTQAFKDLEGNSFWFLARDRDGEGEIKQIYQLRPDKITIVPDPTNATAVMGYIYSTQDGGKMPLSPKEVLHFKTFNPLGNHPFVHRGMGIVQASAWSIDTDNEVRKWNYSFFKNSARPDGILYSDGGAVDQTDYNRLREQWKQEHQGSENTGKVAILSGGIKWQEVSRSQKDMDFVAQRNFNRDEIMSLFKVPKPILGITEDVNRANADASIYVFALRTIKPAMQRIVDTLNEFLVPEFGDTLELRFTSPVPDDRTETVAGYTVGINKWLSRNEIRAFEGLPPTENGDSFFGTMSDMPIDEVKAQPVKSAKPTSKCSHTSTEKIIDAFMAKKSPARVVKSANDKKAVYLEEWNKAVDKNATLLKKKLIQYFDKQKAEVIKNVNEELKGLEAKEYIYKGVDDMLFDTDTAISTGISLITPFIENFIKESGGSASALVNGTFDSSTSNISKFIADRSKFFAKTINETTKDELFTTIKDGISNGEDLASISERVSEVYVKATDFRTDMIARTEVSASANFGAIEAYTQAGVEKIEWKVVNPEDDDCLMNEGVEVKIGEAFPSGDTYPPIHPNCVCTTIPIFND
jgi:HK97 family phage portal protein